MTARHLSLSLFAFTGLVTASPAFADAIADFFQGKQIKYVVQAGPGGAYGLNAQTVANHVSKHIPGNPTMVVQHMPGAGGLKASNYIYNAAPKDGTVWGMLSPDLAAVQKMRPSEVRYDAAKFGWLGRILPYTTVLSVYHAAGVRKADDLKNKEIILGQTGRGNVNFIQALMLQDLLGYKIKNVAGYRGGNDMYLAMERGEIHGRIGSWTSLKTTKADWLADKKMDLLLVMSNSREKELPDVPTVVELASDQKTRDIFTFFGGATDVGWSACTPPDVAPERLAALRKAFDATMKDPAFQAEMKKHRLDLDPTTGAEVEAVIRKTLAVSAEVVQNVVKYTTQ